MKKLLVIGLATLAFAAIVAIRSQEERKVWK